MSHTANDTVPCLAMGRGEGKSLPVGHLVQLGRTGSDDHDGSATPQAAEPLHPSSEAVPGSFAIMACSGLSCHLSRAAVDHWMLAQACHLSQGVSKTVCCVCPAGCPCLFRSPSQKQSA